MSRTRSATGAPSRVRGREAIVLVASLVLVAAAAGSQSAFARSHGRSAAPAVVKVGKTALGRVLVDGRGRTLYLFEADNGKRSVCYGKCATFWPPLLTTGKPHAGTGARAALLGTTRRKNGTLQVTYHGHPLYRFLKDRNRAGRTRGQGLDAFGAEWYVLTPAGVKLEKETGSGDSGVTTTTTTTATTTTTGGYGGYG
jgi:predicted lipoprotein with Yx(FWY)xxD motif